MPAYLVKVTTRHGLVKAPIVANCTDEAEVTRLMKALGDEGDVIEIKGIRPDSMRVAFGNVPAGSAVFRFDWIWSVDGKEPKPY